MIASGMAQRVWTALVAMTLILGSLHWPAWWAFVIVAILALFLGGEELARLLNWGIKSRVSAGLYSMGVGGFCFWASEFGPLWVLIGLGIVFVVGCLSLFLRNTEKPHPLAWLGMGWLSAPICALVSLHLWSFGHGPNAVALIFLSLWGGDSLALLVGKAVGKNLLAPTLSPSKTWEGAIGGFIGALAAAVGFASAFEASLWIGAGVGVICGVLGLLGDLFESFLKRRMKVKDSGGVFPGHGGMLDRIDSMLMASIPASALLLLMESHLFQLEGWGRFLR